MPTDRTPPDHLTLTGLGGLFNGEVFLLNPGESGTIGATSLATFPVTLCRNYRRLADDPSREELLTRLAPEHVRFVYIGDGRLVVENLPGQSVRVGWREVRDRIEVDLAAGAVEIGFGYGERVVAAFPGSPPEFQELAPPPSEDAEVEGVFVALLEPEGPLAGVLARAARNLSERDTSGEIDYELAEDPREVDPERDTGPLPPIPPLPTPVREKEKKKKNRGFFRRGPHLFLSILLHLVVILGLFAWIRPRLSTPEPPTVTVSVRDWPKPLAPEARPAPPTPESETRAENRPLPAPAVPELEAGPAEAEAPGPTAAGPGGGAAGPVGVGAGEAGAGPSGAGPMPAAGMAGGGGAVSHRPPVDRALAWLARHQRPDGSWGAISSLESCRECTDPGRRDYPVAMTAAALLAFAGAGHTHRAGDYPEVVTKALRWLVDHQREDGAFRTVHSTAEDRPVYGDALATFALAEIHRQSRSPRLRGTLGRAVSGLVAAQQPYAGWRYLPAARDSDTSVTSLAAFALIAAERSGVPVNPAARFGIRTWMREVTDPTSGRVGYRERGRGSLGMTAAALAVRLLEGEPVGSSSVRAQCELLRENLPSLPAPGAPAPPGNPPDLFYWYFGSVAARHFARADARVWSEAVLAVLPGLQVDSGEARGSFGPFGRWSRVGGRVFTTAFAALVLELAYDFPEAFR